MKRYLGLMVTVALCASICVQGMEPPPVPRLNYGPDSRNDPEANALLREFKKEQEELTEKVVRKKMNEVAKILNRLRKIGSTEDWPFVFGIEENILRLRLYAKKLPEVDIESDSQFPENLSRLVGKIFQAAKETDWVKIKNVKKRVKKLLEKHFYPALKERLLSLFKEDKLSRDDVFNFVLRLERAALPGVKKFAGETRKKVRKLIEQTNEEWLKSEEEEWESESEDDMPIPVEEKKKKKKESPESLDGYRKKIDAIFERDLEELISEKSWGELLSKEEILEARSDIEGIKNEDKKTMWHLRIAFEERLSKLEKILELLSDYAERSPEERMDPSPKQVVGRYMPRIRKLEEEFYGLYRRLLDKREIVPLPAIKVEERKKYFDVILPKVKKMLKKIKNL